MIFSLIMLTGLIADAYFSASKIAWILDNVEGAREQAEEGNLLFGTVDTWLIWNLTKGAVHVTDYTNAARTMLFDIHRCCWEEEILELFRIPKEMLPEVRPSSGFFGETQEQIFGGKIPVMGVAGDQQAALFGQCCFEKGGCKKIPMEPVCFLFDAYRKGTNHFQTWTAYDHCCGYCRGRWNMH